MKYLIELNDSIELHELIEVNLIRQGKGHNKRHEYAREIMQGNSLTRDTGDWATIERSFDRENDKYDEIVKDSKGNIIYNEHIPLHEKSPYKREKS